VDQVYIGSCTNGRYEDLEIAASILKGKKIDSKVRGILAPATPAVYQRALETGILRIFLDAGFCVTNPTCGACLGMSNGVLAPGEVCASTTNRNFNGRMGKGGMVHLMSPATAAATAVAGYITNSSLYKNR
nr:3-isopropylmalate dehydratase [Spirochaetales bacterium]